MIENILARKGISLKIRLTVKSLVSAGIVVLAVMLPQLVHLAAGPSGGMTWLPMYLPVLLGGCLLGKWWGLGVGILSPLVSFAVTSAMGNAMPAAARLPFMTAELAVFAAVSGLFSEKISENGYGISRSIARSGERSCGISSPHGDFPKHCTLYGFRCLVADSERFYRFDFTGRTRAADGYGNTRTHAERQEE